MLLTKVRLLQLQGQLAVVRDTESDPSSGSNVAKCPRIDLGQSQATHVVLAWGLTRWLSFCQEDSTTAHIHD